MWNRLLEYLAVHPVVAETAVVVLGALLGMEVIFAIGKLREVARFRKRGYRVRLLKGQRYAYEEPVTRSEERHVLPFRRMTVAGTLVADVPNEDVWDDQVPPWARGRRAEILKRIEEVFQQRS